MSLSFWGQAGCSERLDLLERREYASAERSIILDASSLYSQKSSQKKSMIRLTKLSSILALAIAMASFSSTAMASSIGVNVGPSRGENEEANAESTLNNEIPSDVSAGVVPQTNWNNLLEGNFGTQEIVDDTGTLLTTTASVSTQWTNGVQAHGSEDGDQILMNGGLDGGNTTELTSTVTGIPYENYDVYIYFDGGNDNGRGGTYTATPSGAGASAPQSQDGYDLASFSGTYIQATGTGLDEEGQPVGSNYVVFSGMSGENLEIKSIPITHPTNVSRAPWNAFQIVEVGGPGPPTITEIDYTSADGMLTLTWNSKPGESYAIKYSEDMISWDSDIDDGYPAAEGGDTTTATFNLNDFGLGSDSRLFFRIEK